MLTSNIQKSIRTSYQNLQAQLDNFVPRRAQNYLVAEIAKTLCGQYHKSNRMLVAEAGTGIGKSLSYLMAVIPVAVYNNRKVVISTATVALQEQLVNKDLPLFRRITDREFSFILAKGANVIAARRNSQRQVVSMADNLPCLRLSQKERH